MSSPTAPGLVNSWICENASEASPEDKKEEFTWLSVIERSSLTLSWCVWVCPTEIATEPGTANPDVALEVPCTVTVALPTAVPLLFESVAVWLPEVVYVCETIKSQFAVQPAAVAMGTTAVPSPKFIV